MDYDPRACGAQCDDCPLRDFGPPVPPEANPNATVIAIGKAPGDHEKKWLAPYKGPAGKEVTAAFRTAGMPRRSIHWTTTVLCQPPNNDLKRVSAKIQKANAKLRKAWEKECRAANKASTPLPPRPDYALTPAEACRPRLAQEIARFRHIVPMGTAATKSILGHGASIMKVRGGMVDGLFQYDAASNAFSVYEAEDAQGHAAVQAASGAHDVKILPIFEPAFVMRARRWTKAFRTDVTRAVRWFKGTLEMRDPTVHLNPSPGALRAFLAVPDALYAYDVETDTRGTGLPYFDALKDRLNCVAIGDTDTVMVVGFTSRHDPHAAFYSDAEMAEIWTVLRDYFEDRTKMKCGHNAGAYDYAVVKHWFGVEPLPVLDTILLHRSVESELPHNLGFVASIYAPAIKAWKSDREGKKLATEAESDEDLQVYCGKDVSSTHIIVKPLLDAVHERGQWNVVLKDHRVQRVCSDMHEIGMYVDPGKRMAVESDLIQKAVKLRNDLRGLTGDPNFNPGSRDQLAALWFGKWKLRPTLDEETMYTASGAISTADVVVRECLKLPDLPDHVREHLLLTRKYRKTQKVLGTYVAKLRRVDETVTIGWDDEDDPDERAYREKYKISKRGVTWPDGRVHPGYSAHITNIGRLSSGRPVNAQNFPRWLRSMIRAAPGNVLVGADADQFHIRIFSSLWGAARYLEAFARGADPHATTADAVFPMSNRKGNRFREMDGFPGGHWDSDGYFIPDGEGDWEGPAYKTRVLGKKVQFSSAYAAGLETIHRIMTSAEDKDGALTYLHLTRPEVRIMHANWLGGLPEIKKGWAQEKALYDAHGYLADPVDGRRKDFLDGATPQELANYRTLASEAALMNGAMLDVTDELPLGCFGPNTGLITQCHDSMVYEVPADGVYEVNGRLMATKGTPAWRTLNVLREALNYEHPALSGVQFTSKPALGWTWAEVG